MKRKIIRIENGIVSVPQSGEVKMTASEIASLFDVYVRSINDHAKAILKSGIIQIDVSCPATVIGNTIMPDVYGLDMITALAFRIQSHKAEVFRSWLMKQAVKQPSVSIWWGNEQKICLN
jgi:hypothetical protein